MQSDYMYMNDVIFSLSDDVKLMFQTIVSFSSTNSKTYSNYNEYKINNKSSCNTMVKRNLSYYLYFDDRRGKMGKLCIYPEQMFELLRNFEHIKSIWIDRDSIGLYAFMDNRLMVSNHDEYILMRLPMDKVMKIAPGVLKTETEDIKCIDFYLNSMEPLHVTHSSFLGLYYVLLHLDMLSYANTALSFLLLMDTPLNRTDFASQSSGQALAEDTSTASGTNGRTFTSKRKSFFDK